MKKLIKIKSLINILKKNNSNFFTGVPDSVLKELSIYLQPKNKRQHVIASNEGAAVSIGIGHYLSTKRIPCIYLQFSKKNMPMELKDFHGNIIL